LLVVLGAILNDYVDLCVAELLGFAYSIWAFSLGRLVRQDPIDCRITEVITLLELNFWHLSKPVQLAYRFLLLCRDFKDFLVVKIEWGVEGGILVFLVGGRLAKFKILSPDCTDYRD